MTRIHPTAVVDSQAEIHPSVEIGAHCVVEGAVRLGEDCRLYPQVTILGHTKIGPRNVFFPGAVIGAPPQDLKYDSEPTHLEIGADNRFREHVTVHPGTLQGGGTTVIGDRNLLMIGCHVAHDCHLGDQVVLSNHVLLAGHINVGDGAIFNGASACHHFTTVGRMAYIGGLTRVTQDVHPFSIVEGHPARIRACNTIGMQRAGFDADDIAMVRSAIFSIFVSDRQSASEAIAEIEEENGSHPLIQELLDSVRASQQGRQGRAAESPSGGAKEQRQQ
jgi:UDP-N-acetylglucosamine acyltransferase